MLIGDIVRIGEKADANGVTMMNQHAIKMRSDVQQVGIIFLLSKVPLQIKLRMTHCRHPIPASRFIYTDTVSIRYLSLNAMVSRGSSTIVNQLHAHAIFWQFGVLLQPPSS